MNRIGIFKRIMCLIAAIAIASVSCAALIGCSFFDDDDYDYVEFSQSRLEMSIGDEYDLSRLILTNTGSYELKSSSPSVASLSGTVLTANAKGSATITASCKTSMYVSNIRVTVLDEDSIAIVADGALCQTVNSTKELNFTPILTGTIRTSNVNWYVNGVYSETLASTESFGFTPSSVGTAVIKAVSAGNEKISAEAIVRVYYSVTAEGKSNGQLQQSESPYLPINLAVEIVGNPLNPENCIEWSVDGNIVYSGAETEYIYRPAAGTHTVTLTVNGEKRTINGENSLTVICYGSIVPDKPEIVFDNMYPHVYITHNAVGKAKIEINDGQAVKEYSENDSRYSKLFEDGRIDVGTLMSLCATSVMQKEYTFRVKSIGDGGVYTESDYSEKLRFTQLPAAAKPYISSIYLDRDHYLTSDEEYVNAFEFYVINRSKTSRKPKVEFDCYVGYDLIYSADDLWTYAFNIGATSGMYDGLGAELRDGGKVLHSEFTVDTVNTPDRQTYSVINEYFGDYSEQLHSNIPHINYDQAKYRAENYVFPIDRCVRTQSVKYTDELYLAAENNTRPLPVSGSSAETVYKMARDILCKIVTDDMTDVQKAHAIYDWIMWQVTYDTPATEVTSDGEAYSAYYLEGVFGDGKTYIDGVKYSPYAVCDGMSKAYSLMCNMEGIPCLRVSGMAGDGAAGSGGHAWNKVKLGDEWYIVDCTWGDSVAELQLDGLTGDYELGLHDWLFVTDDYAADTHYEPYMYGGINAEWGDCDIVYAPQTALESYPVYKEWTYNGVKINCEIGYGEDQSERLREIVTAFSKAYAPRSTINVPGGKNDGLYTVKYESIEIHFKSTCLLSKNDIDRRVKSTVSALRPSAKCEVYQYEDTLLVLLKDR